ncbi:hypothetical protein [Marinobacter shengliensis]
MLIDQDVRTLTKRTELPPPALSETDQTSARCEAQPCKDETFATVIYVTGQRSFWLVPQNVLDKIEASADRLQTAASKATAEQRLAELEQAGLTDLFLPATAQSFLLPAEQEEWVRLHEDNLADERALKTLDEELQAAEDVYLAKVRSLVRDDAFYRKQLALKAEWHTEKVELESRQGDIRDKIEDRRERLEDLREEGLDAAKAAGFDVVGGDLYSPEQRKIQDILSDYLDARKAFENDTLGNDTQTDRFINAMRLNRELVAYEKGRETLDVEKIEKYLTELNALEGKMLKYSEAVLKLANIGIATPEYALANGQGDVPSGILELGSFKQLEWDVERLTKDMKEHGHAWLRVLGMNGPAPAPALLKFQTRIEACQEQQEQLKCKAKERAEALVPARMFMWNPAEFEPSPHKSLVRPGIPLREFSLPKGGSTVRHFTIDNLPGSNDYLNTSSSPNSEAEPARRFELATSIKLAQSPDQDAALDKILTDLGAKKYPLRPHWFDAQGLFVPERFFNALKGERILALQSQDDMDAWGAHLRCFIFQSEAQRHLMGFDDSYAGQFTRLILSGIAGDRGDEWKNSVNVEVVSEAGLSPAVSVGRNGSGKIAPAYQLTDVSVGANLTYRQGQLDIISLRLPEPEDAELITLSYFTEAGKSELEMGRFHCSLDVKCWGFVGAGILLSHSLGVEAVEGEGIRVIGRYREEIETENGSGAGTSQTGNRKQYENGVEGVKLNAFAGAQAGILARAEIKWAIPDRLRKKETWRLLGEEVPEWITVGLVTGELVGSAGLGADVDFRIGLRNKRLVLFWKGKVVAGAGGGASIGVELAYDTLPLWMRLLQLELHENGYRRIYWIDPEAFQYMSLLMNLCLSTALKISFLAAQSYDFVQKVYSDFYSSENAGVVAVRIHEAIEIAEGRLVPSDDVSRVTLDEYESWFMGLQPEAIGPMLYNLVSEPVKLKGGHGQEPKTESEMLKAQQTSILQCLRWMSGSELVRPESYRGAGPNRVQRQFEESVTRMNIRGKKPDGDLLLVARNNVVRLDEFMSRGLDSRKDDERYDEYQKLRKKFSIHIWGQA